MRDLESLRARLAQRPRPSDQDEQEWKTTRWKLGFARADEWLDRALGTRHLQEARLAQVAADALCHFAGTRYDLLGFVVMPSHLHWGFQPLESWVKVRKPGKRPRTPREDIVHSVNRHSAFRCNQEAQLYINEVRTAPGLLQVLTDDDEIELAYYFFDDTYLARHGDRTAYLLREDWKMPAEVGGGGFKPAVRTTRVGKARGEGATYLLFHGCWDSGNLEDLEGGYRILEGGYRIDGVRLPQLVLYLLRNEVPDEGCCFSYDMRALRSQLLPDGKRAKAPEDPFLFALREDPDDDAHWGVFNDWLAERDERSAGTFLLERALRGVTHQPPDGYPNWQFDPKKSLIQVEEHVAVLCRNVSHDWYHQWYLFDDLWASAHPDLANALLRYVRRWDVL